jgi:hypothetical protein
MNPFLSILALRKEAHNELAIKLDPSSYRAHQSYAFLLSSLGRTLQQESVMSAILKGYELPRVTGTASLGNIPRINGTRRISAVQDVLMGPERFEGCFVAAMATLTTHKITTMG